MMNKNDLFLPSPYSSFCRILCLFFGCFLSLFDLWAQECNPNNSGTATGCFTISATYNGITQTDISRVCLGTEIRVTECTPSRGNDIRNVFYDYDDNPGSDNPTRGALSPTNAKTYTYTLPGTYTIVQRGSGEPSSGITCISLRKQIVVLPTPEPEFSLTTCTGQKVILTIPANHPNNPYETYRVDWGDGTAPQTIAAGSERHTYLAGGEKAVTVTGVYQPGGCGNASTKTVTPTNVLNPPQLRQLTVKDNASVELAFTVSAAYPTYEIFQRVSPASYQSIQALNTPASGVVLFTGLNTQSNTYCYKVVASDACGQSLDLGELCTAQLEATAQNKQNGLRWPVYAGSGFQSYGLYRDNEPITNWPDDGNTQHTDADVKCGRTYCYALEVRTATARSLSQTQCVTAISDEKPAPLENFTATVLDGKTVLAWKKPEFFTARSYKIERSVNDGPFRVFGQIAATNGQFIDSSIANDSTHFCYRISYADVCGNESDPTDPACPIRLKKTENPSNPALYPLEWSAYRDWPAGVKMYVVELLDEGGNVQESVDAGPALRYSKNERVTRQQVLYFRVKAISNDLMPLISYSNVITYVQTLQVFLPDAFTPNEDGLNDQYGANGLFVRDFQMQIFNRWGALLFVSNSMDERWDGTYQGIVSPPGTYVCKIEAFDFRGKRITKNKIFALIR